MSPAWLTLAASFVILAVYRTVSSAFSILVVPLQDELGASRATVTLIFTAHMLVYAVASLLTGIAIHRVGPRWTIAFGGLMLGFGLVAMASGHSVLALSLAFGLLCGSGIAFVGLPPNVMILSQRFPNRVATAMGVAGAGMGVGVLLLIPAIQFVADRHGWRTAFMWAGVATALIVAGCAWLQGLRAHRASSVLSGSVSGESGNATAGAMTRSGRARMLEIVRLPKWQMFAAANFLMGSALFGVLTHQVALLRETGWSAIAAATALGVVNVLRSFAGPMWGVILDRYGRRFGYGISMALAVAGIASIVAAPVSWAGMEVAAFLFIAAFGIGSAGTLPTNASMGTELFAIELRPFAWGFTETAYAAGAAFGSWVVGWLFDLRGNYAAGLSLAGLQFVLSYVFVVMLSPSRAMPRQAARP